MIVRIEIELDPEYADSGHSTGLTNEGYEKLSEAVSAFGDIETIEKVVDQR